MPANMSLGDDLIKAWREDGARRAVRRLPEFTDEGLVLGAGTLLVAAGQDAAGLRCLKLAGCEAEVLAKLSAAYGRALSSRVLECLRLASAVWGKGEVARAHIVLAQAGLGELSHDDTHAVLRLFLTDRMLKRGDEPGLILDAFGLLPEGLPPALWRKWAKYNAEQLRDDLGRWVAEGAAVVSGAARHIRDALTVQAGPKIEGPMPPRPGALPDTHEIQGQMPPPPPKQGVPSAVEEKSSSETPAKDAAPKDGNAPVTVDGLPPASSPVPNPQIRGVDTPPDADGSGGFGVSRDGGSRAHGGVDLIAEPGTEVTSPVTGTVVGTFDPYGSDPRKSNKYSGVQILTDDGYVVKVMYVKGALKEGGRVVAGKTVIGHVQDLHLLYPKIQNHIHFEVRRSGRPVNPTALVMAWQRRH